MRALQEDGTGMTHPPYINQEFAPDQSRDATRAGGVAMEHETRAESWRCKLPSLDGLTNRRYAELHPT